MKYFLPLLLLLTGCPAFIDLSTGYGSNLTLEKTLKVNQKQTDAQVAAQVAVIGDIIKVVPAVVPLVAIPEPTPEYYRVVPAVPVVKEYTILQPPSKMERDCEPKRLPKSFHDKVPCK